MENDVAQNWKGKRVVVFGAGYVGGRFAKHAAEQGAEVVALTRNEKTAARLKEDGVGEVIVANLHEDTWREKIMPKADLVLNTVSAAESSLEGYRISYVEGQKQVADWMAKGDVEHFIYTSSTGVYTQTGGEWVTEGDASAGESPRAGVLIEAEGIALKAEAKRRSVLRLAGIYGPGRHYLLDQLRLGLRELPGDPDAYLNLIYIEDILGAIEGLSGASIPEGEDVFNVCDDSPVLKKELVEWLSEKLEIEPPAFVGSEPSAKTPFDTPKRPNRRVSNRHIKTKINGFPKCPKYTDGYSVLFDS